MTGNPADTIVAGGNSKAPDPLHLSSVLNWFQNQLAPSTGWQGTPPAQPAAQPAAAPGAAPGAAPLAQGAPTAVDPLAVQLFFSQAIAPMLQNLASGLQSQNANLEKYAGTHLEHAHMPDYYKQVFGQTLNDNSKAQNDVIASLTGGAASAGALDQLMANVSAARQASQKAYYEQLLGQISGGGGAFDSAAAQIAAGQQASGG